jgi:hypothetical protein
MSLGEPSRLSQSQAASPFANYLNAAHQRLHVRFADGVLSSSSRDPEADHSSEQLYLNLLVEMVVDGDTGCLLRLGVVRSSGVTEFDVRTLESVVAATPFSRAPPLIRSFDGSVYLRWEFSSGPHIACTTFSAHPYELTAAQN